MKSIDRRGPDSSSSSPSSSYIYIYSGVRVAQDPSGVQHHLAMSGQWLQPCHKHPMAWPDPPGTTRATTLPTGTTRHEDTPEDIPDRHDLCNHCGECRICNPPHLWTENAITVDNSIPERVVFTQQHVLKKRRLEQQPVPLHLFDHLKTSEDHSTKSEDPIAGSPAGDNLDESEDSDLVTRVKRSTRVLEDTIAGSPAGDNLDESDNSEDSEDHGHSSEEERQRRRAEIYGTPISTRSDSLEENPEKEQENPDSESSSQEWWEPLFANMPTPISTPLFASMPTPSRTTTPATAGTPTPTTAGTPSPTTAGTPTSTAPSNNEDSHFNFQFQFKIRRIPRKTTTRRC